MPVTSFVAPDTGAELETLLAEIERKKGTITSILNYGDRIVVVTAARRKETRA